MTTPTLSIPSLVDPPVGVVGEAARLARDAAAAARVRTWQMHPDVVALRVERIRTQVDRLMWAGITAGLCLTMANVQQFAAAGAAVGSLTWCAAWLLDPMVSLVLLAVLRAEQITTRYQVSTGVWPRVSTWVLLAAMYVMNTWSAWAAGSASGVVLHSVPPLVVVLAAEAVTDLQYALTDCVHRAHAAATARAAEAGPRPAPPASQVGSDYTLHSSAPPVPAVVTTGASGERPVAAAGERLARGVNPSARAATGCVAGVSAGGSRRGPRGRRSAPVRRKLLADYVGEARAAWTPGVVVSPAWVRQVTDCSRGLSSKVAAALNADPALRHPTTVTVVESLGRAG
jgi:hypothetical protein